MNELEAARMIAGNLATLPIKLYWREPCRAKFPESWFLGGDVHGGFVDPFDTQPPGTYTGPNVKLGDYYVRELERIGSEHRQVVRYEVVGTGRVETMARSRFDRQARAA